VVLSHNVRYLSAYRSRPNVVMTWVDATHLDVKVVASLNLSNPTSLGSGCMCVHEADTGRLLAILVGCTGTGMLCGIDVEPMFTRRRGKVPFSFSSNNNGNEKDDEGEDDGFPARVIAFFENRVTLYTLPRRLLPFSSSSPFTLYPVVEYPLVTHTPRSFVQYQGMMMFEDMGAIRVIDLETGKEGSQRLESGRGKVLDMEVLGEEEFLAVVDDAVLRLRHEDEEIVKEEEGGGGGGSTLFPPPFSITSI